MVNKLFIAPRKSSKVPFSAPGYTRNTQSKPCFKSFFCFPTSAEIRLLMRFLITAFLETLVGTTKANRLVFRVFTATFRVIGPDRDTRLEENTLEKSTEFTRRSFLGNTIATIPLNERALCGGGA